MCLIWRFMVTKKRTRKYISRMGQKTGTSNTGKNVRQNPIASALNAEYLRRRHSAVVHVLALHSLTRAAKRPTACRAGPGGGQPKPAQCPSWGDDPPLIALTSLHRIERMSLAAPQQA